MTLTLDLDRRTLSDGARSVHLSRQRCRFLEILARSPERYTSHATLIHQLWPDDGPDQPDNTLKTVVCMVRADATAAGLALDIRTQWGDGYTLVSPITIISREQVVTIPVALAQDIQRLLYSHSDRRAADVALDAMGALP